MSTKTTTAKKSPTSKGTTHKAKGKSAKAKASWAETMKKALEKRQSTSGYPQQPKPRDSTVQPVRKNAF
jgi:ubiquitin